MPSLDQYLSDKRGRQSDLARRLRLGAGMLSSIRSGFRKPSIELARRIELATNGEVTASDLLGLHETGTELAPPSDAHALGDGRWCVTVRPDGSVALTPAMIRDLGFFPEDQLIFARAGALVSVTADTDAPARGDKMAARCESADIDLGCDFTADLRAEEGRE